MIRCRCCNENITLKLFSAELLKKNIDYFECNKCGYVFTEDPTWLNEAYKNPINNSDTGIMLRNLSNTSLVMATLTLMKKRKSYLDLLIGKGSPIEGLINKSMIINMYKKDNPKDNQYLTCLINVAMWMKKFNFKWLD